MTSNKRGSFTRDEVEQSIPERFEKQVKKFPDHISVKDGNIQLSYNDLNQESNRVARAILDVRENSNDPVAFLLDHGISQIVAILGILKAGKIFVPLDPSFPDRRIRYMLRDSHSSIIITNTCNLSQAKALTEDNQQVINIDKLTTNIPSENLDISITPDTIACIIYTSGSTGQPKGVFQNHRAVLHHIMLYTNLYPITPDDRITLLFSTSFSGAYCTLFGALLNGATLLSYNVKKDGIISLAKWLKDEKATYYQSVPTLFRALVDTLSPDDKFPHLHVIMLGGEPTLRRDVDLYKEHFSDNCILWVRLAGSEMNLVRSHIIDKKTQIDDSIVPPGYPVPDKQIVLMDEDGKELGYNEVGEIVVKSRYLMQGYWKQPELTQTALKIDPKDPSLRIYRTGDLGRMRPDNCLEYLGRKDFQVKIRGYRVEVAEIEISLLELKSIKEAVVLAKDNQSGGKKLVAYCVPAEKPAPTVTSIRNALAKKLPEYYIPATILMLDTLPQTATGKVDRKALQDKKDISPVLDESYVAPETPVERQIADIWCQLLGIDKIGVNDNFFELGGDSILGMRFFVEIDRTMKKKVPFEFLFLAPTVRKLAQILCRNDLPSESNLLVPVQPQGPKPPFFWVHGGGSVLYLKQCLGLKQPFYYFRDQWKSSDPICGKSIEEIALNHVTSIRAVKPKGPYFIGGFSLGGLIAFEMAHQLSEHGEDIALLFLLDPANIFSSYVWPQKNVSSLTRISQLLRSKNSLLDIKNC